MASRAAGDPRGLGLERLEVEVEHRAPRPAAVERPPPLGLDPLDDARAAGRRPRSSRAPAGGASSLEVSSAVRRPRAASCSASASAASAAASASLGVGRRGLELQHGHPPLGPGSRSTGPAGWPSGSMSPSSWASSPCRGCPRPSLGLGAGLRRPARRQPVAASSRAAMWASWTCQWTRGSRAASCSASSSARRARHSPRLSSSRARASSPSVSATSISARRRSARSSRSARRGQLRLGFGQLARPGCDAAGWRPPGRRRLCAPLARLFGGAAVALSRAASTSASRRDRRRQRRVGRGQARLWACASSLGQALQLGAAAERAGGRWRRPARKNGAVGPAQRATAVARAPRSRRAARGPSAAAGPSARSRRRADGPSPCWRGPGSTGSRTRAPGCSLGVPGLDRVHGRAVAHQHGVHPVAQQPLGQLGIVAAGADEIAQRAEDRAAEPDPGRRAARRRRERGRPVALQLLQRLAPGGELSQRLPRRRGVGPLAAPRARGSRPPGGAPRSASAAVRRGFWP